MVILGLGTNVGNRLSSLRRALQLIKHIPNFFVKNISPVYLSDALMPSDAPLSWNKPYLNVALRCETTLDPYTLLQHTNNIEVAMGRRPEKDWAPRPMDIDILAWDDRVQYDDKLHIPHEHLHQRPFALWPLADVAPHWIYPLDNVFHRKTAAEMVAAWGSRFTGEAPLRTKQILQRIDTSELVGVLNITPDSFSDGGNFMDVASAVLHAYRLVEQGADVIDIGAEATGPSAIPLSPAEEWQRLEPVLSAILSERKDMVILPKISVDTRHASVAKKALELGVDWINDVGGLSDPAMCEVVAAGRCDVVVMHQLGLPVSQSSLLSLQQNPVRLVYNWAEKKLSALEAMGLTRERVIVDVGIGFGKTAEQSMQLIHNISEFHSLKTRLMVGHSRKSFLTLFTNESAGNRDIETLPISLYLADKGVDYLRVHNVEMCARALKVKCALV